jgi:hypothetical protein
MSVTTNNSADNPWVPGMIQDVFVPDQLISGPLQVVSETVTINAGANYARGTVLGQITATGAYTLSVKTAVDGSQNPSAILADQANAAAGSVTAGAYVMGEFNQNRLIFDPSWTLAQLQTAMRPYTIFLRDTVQAPLAAS